MSEKSFKPGDVVRALSSGWDATCPSYGCSMMAPNYIAEKYKSINAFEFYTVRSVYDGFISIEEAPGKLFSVELFSALQNNAPKPRTIIDYKARWIEALKCKYEGLTASTRDAIVQLSREVFDLELTRPVTFTETPK